MQGHAWSGEGDWGGASAKGQNQQGTANWRPQQGAEDAAWGGTGKGGWPAGAEGKGDWWPGAKGAWGCGDSWSGAESKGGWWPGAEGNASWWPGMMGKGWPNALESSWSEAALWAAGAEAACWGKGAGVTPRVSFGAGGLGGGGDQLTRMIQTSAPGDIGRLTGKSGPYLAGHLGGKSGPSSATSGSLGMHPKLSQQQQRQQQIDASDWFCKCGEINFRARTSCGKCSAPKQEDPTSALEWEEVCKMYRKRSRSRSRSKRSKDKRRRKSRSRRRRKSSTSSSSSSSDGRKRRKLKRKTTSEVNLAGDDSPVDVSDSDKPKPPKVADDPEIEKTKSVMLQRIMALKDAGLALEEKRRQWRAIMREWHPDKHDNKEHATAIFQFLQKAKAVLNLDTQQVE